MNIQTVIMDTKLTSVKVIRDLYYEFKKISIDEKISLQQLVNRSINLYIYDDRFKKTINEYKNLSLISGSHF